MALGAPLVSQEAAAAPTASAHCLPTYTACSGAVAYDTELCADGSLFAALISFDVCIQAAGAAAATLFIGTGVTWANMNLEGTVEAVSVEAETDGEYDHSAGNDCVKFGIFGCGAHADGTNGRAEARACHVDVYYGSPLTCAHALAEVESRVLPPTRSQAQDCRALDPGELTSEQEAEIRAWAQDGLAVYLHERFDGALAEVPGIGTHWTSFLDATAAHAALAGTLSAC